MTVKAFWGYLRNTREKNPYFVIYMNMDVVDEFTPKVIYLVVLTR